MGNYNNEEEAKSRRWFLSLFTLTDKKKDKPEMVKMLTADGKLVEVEKAVLDKIANKKKATNGDIYTWMDNPSKKNNQ